MNIGTLFIYVDKNSRYLHKPSAWGDFTVLIRPKNYIRVALRQDKWSPEVNGMVHCLFLTFSCVQQCLTMVSYIYVPRNGIHHHLGRASEERGPLLSPTKHLHKCKAAFFLYYTDHELILFPRNSV